MTSPATRPGSPIGNPHGGRSIKADIDATAPPANGIALWHLGQSGFVVKAGKTILYLDPCREAGDLADAMGAGLLVPMHVGMHMANTERPGALSDYLADRYPYQRYHFMTPGEKVLYLKEGGDGALAF